MTDRAAGCRDSLWEKKGMDVELEPRQERTKDMKRKPGFNKLSGKV